jgi:hypothetical protein
LKRCADLVTHKLLHLPARAGIMRTEARCSTPASTEPHGDARATHNACPPVNLDKGERMSELDLGNLRPWLDEQEKFARAVLPVDPGYKAAQDMLASIDEARERLKPSADSTANFVDNKAIIEQLGALRAQVESATKGKG